MHAAVLAKCEDKIVPLEVGERPERDTVFPHTLAWQLRIEISLFLILEASGTYMALTLFAALMNLLIS